MNSPSNRKTAICADCREFHGGRKTGIGRYLQNLLIPLSRDPHIGLTCCAAPGALLPPELAANAAVQILPAWPVLLVDQIALPRAAAKCRANWFFSPYYKTPLAGPFRKIVTVHDIMFLRLPHDPPLKRLAAALQLRLAAHCADIILADSDFTAADLANYLPAVRPKIRRIYPDLGKGWVDSEAPKPQPAVTPPYFLYVGNFKPHKNVDLLIRAFAGLVRGAPGFRHNLTLAGADPVNASRIQTLISENSLSDRIRIEINISENRLRILYRAADWLVTASCYEGFGYPVVEAFACGCPVICNPNTSLKEIAGHAALEIPDLSVESLSTTLAAAAAMPAAERNDFIEKGEKRSSAFDPGTAAALFLEAIHHHD